MLPIPVATQPHELIRIHRRTQPAALNVLLLTMQP